MPVVLLMGFLLLILAYLTFLSMRFYSAWLSDHAGAPFQPLEPEMVRRALDGAQLKPGQTLMDLGSGDGRVLIEAWKRYGVKGIGVEIAWFPRWRARRRLRALREPAEVVLEAGNFYDADITRAEVLFLYQRPRIMQRLREKFEAELHRPTQVISVRFPIEGWQPVGQDHAGCYPIYYYQWPV